MSVRLRAATWNIHGGIGSDGRHLPGRVVEVLAELDADVVALQEVLASASEHGEFLARVAKETGYHVADGPLHQRRGSDFGNAVLSRHPIRAVAHLDLTVDDYEPRGALDVSIDAGAAALRVVATHLGLRPGERREQVRRILAAVERDRPQPTLLMGDLNEWYLWGRPLRWLHSHFRETPATPATFPARRPVLALDRIWVAPAGSLRGLRRHASPLAQAASDHLPLVAELII
jgi:endonuclease/exonuclease/phosphatase family metal-dependent hydrolase